MLILCSDLVGVTGFELAHPASRTRFGLFDTDSMGYCATKCSNLQQCTTISQLIATQMAHKSTFYLHNVSWIIANKHGSPEAWPSDKN